MIRMGLFPTEVDGRLDFGKLARVHQLVTQLLNVKSSPFAVVLPDKELQTILANSAAVPLH